ncbi:MAG TPA: serine hydrolase domain-containing protein [Bryobacteraceae bacterium]|nr:serine hydrolase domain-containing protein [Bryobacteraceae bacterium]
MSVWLAGVLAALGLLLVIPAVWVFVTVTSKPLHPVAADVPTVGNAAPASGAVSNRVEKARQIALTHLVAKNLPGLSVAVGVDGNVVWAEGLGFADLEGSVRVTPAHRFRIGTASIALTSAAVGLLIEKGRLKLGDEIQAYVPEFPRKQWPVTLRQVMGHTAGLTNDSGDEGPLFSQHCEKPVEALPAFAETPLRFQPGTDFRHSSYGWIVVSSAVEAAARQPFLRFMRERIFDPVGMRDTAPDPSRMEDDDDFPVANLIRELIFDPRARRDRAGRPPSAEEAGQGPLVTAYFPRFAADPGYGLHLMRPLNYSCYAGASVFVSTPSDLARFGMAVQSGQLLQPATVGMLQTSQRLASGEGTDYGLGWYVKTATVNGRSTRLVGHDGHSLGGMVASLVMLPEYRVVVAVTSNISYADTFSVAVKVGEAFVDR